MAILSIAEIMEVQDITERKIPIPEWGGEVVVRSISHRQMRDLKKRVAKEVGDDDEERQNDEVEKQIFLEGLVNPKITDDEFEHILNKSSSAVMKILNGILGASGGEENAVKEEEKNFPAESE
jgi:hypothetical protein